MKLMNKVITLVALSMGLTHVVCPGEQKIVAYKDKGMNIGQPSAIQIWQNGQFISAATFGTATNKKGNSLAPTSFAQTAEEKASNISAKKYLYFLKNNTPVDIYYHFYGNNSNPGQAPNETQGTSPSPTFQSHRQFAQDQIPVGSKIKISKGTGGSATNHPFNIDIEPPLVDVKVKKTDAASQGKKWKIYALNGSLGRETFNPIKHKNKIYSSVTIAKDTTGLNTSKLKVPKDIPFWILVPANSGNGITADKETPMTVKPQANTLINIAGDGTASWAS